MHISALDAPRPLPRSTWMYSSDASVGVAVAVGGVLSHTLPAGQSVLLRGASAEAGAGQEEHGSTGGHTRSPSHHSLGRLLAEQVMWNALVALGQALGLPAC